MHPTRREMLGTLVLASGLAGCAGQSGEVEPTDEPADGADGSAPSTTEEPMAATVGVADHPELGEILVDADGMTLYMFDRDTRGSGESTCSGGCAEAWPPLTVEDDAVAGGGVSADLGTITRDDGTRQVVANGWPLYYYQGDAEPGDVTGQGRGGVWWVLRPDGTPVRPSPTVQVSDHPELGEILVDADGMTLYMFDSDTRGSGASTCYDGCAEAWPPLTVEGSPVAGGDVTAGLETLERDDGAQQVAANGWPLYYFQNDAEPGDVTGQGRGGVWWVLRPDGTPVRPSPTVQVSDHPELGEILVDADGMTLYMFDNDTRGSNASSCYDGCAEAWPPLTVDGEATAGEGVTGELGTFERETGGRQVTANGWPLYYFQNDAEPGDVTGQGRGDVWWVLDPSGVPRKPSGGGSSY